MALETWLIKVKTALLQKKPLFSSSKPKRVAVLSFEMMNVMSKLLHLWQSLSDASVVRLQNDVVALEGVQKLISNDKSFLLSLAVAEFADSVQLVADSVSRLSQNYHDPSLRSFRRVFTELTMSFEDDEYGGRPDKPVLMSQNSRGDSESEEEFGGDESDSEDGETSDEDFRVNEDGVEIEWSSSEENDTSSYDDDDEKMVKRRERNVGSATEDDDMKTKSRTKKMQNHLSEKMVKGRVRKMESATESSGVWRKRKMERENNEEEEEEEEWVGPDCASATSCKSTFSKEETPKEAHNTSHQSVSLQKEPGDSAMAKKSEKNNNVHAKTSVSVDIEKHDSELEKEIDILWKEMDRMLLDGDTEIGDSTVVQMET
ncbi:hypothetical protein Fmac_011102 [Flemingia macrophylla]|uniref:DUF3475 domain-containing protein n=1 Tax=Flemingia macrophylla TaxID=520843 RepID=A0ABD1MLG8_9FABA